MRFYCDVWCVYILFHLTRYARNASHHSSFTKYAYWKDSSEVYGFLMLIRFRPKSNMKHVVQYGTLKCLLYLGPICLISLALQECQLALEVNINPVRLILGSWSLDEWKSSIVQCLRTGQTFAKIVNFLNCSKSTVYVVATIYAEKSEEDYIKQSK